MLDHLGSSLDAPARSWLDHLLEGCQIIGFDWVYVYVNDAAARHGRRSKEDLMGRTMMEVYPGIEKTEMFSILKRCMTERTASRLENEFVLPDGSTGSFELRVEPLPEGIFILSSEITERKRAEARIQSVAKFPDENPGPVLRFARDATLLYANRGSAALLAHWGCDVGGRPPEDVRLSILGAFGANAPVQIEVDLDGASFSLSAAPIRGADYINVYGMDVTKQRRMEEHLRVAQRLEAIGKLAGGVAHDFNNVLSVISSCAEFAIAGVREGDPLRDDLLSIQQAAARAAALTRQLLAFGRKQVLQPEVIALNKVIDDMESMMQRLIGEHIELRLALAADLGNVKADVGQVEQVLMNLVVNARDAMPTGGTITIETSKAELDERYAERHIGVKAGPYVLLSITDTGSGMDEQTKAHLFEPFFTTKATGRGTGLGLSTAYGIVKQSGGHIWFYSELGKGTTFKIYLPRELSAARASGRARAASLRPAGTETILVVEDEEELRRLTKRILAGAGYVVLTAANGEEALQICERCRGPLHLLLTDVFMPKMSGPELAERIVVDRPGLKVLYTSGYADNAVVHHGVLDAGVNFIAKPVMAADLTRKVREVLDQP